MKKLPVCDSLFDEKKELNTWQFCAPVFIASTFFGTLICRDSDLVFKEFSESSVRSGTLTFVSYKGQCFAITCKHVADALENKQAEWKNEQCEKYQNEPAIDGYQFFTPIENSQYHFNYKLTPAPANEDGTQPDIAIARVNHHSITRLGRKPIILTKKESLPGTGIASGYPEEQRAIRQGNNVNTFAPKFTACIATLQVTGKGEILVQDTIADHKGLDVLSGMSGGPIIWSNGTKFGLAGIVREGLDIQPKHGQLMVENGIWIHGERITPELFDRWLNAVPALIELKDETKSLYIPTGMRSLA
ncbi:hypothetical protein [Pseudomonas taeanensis]|uniref:hypothetical protein n=1 Tax=Pseudomonas taeanensis TaxID=574962 RepID=UPI00128EFA6F|nr:hypothetical protein [Pseudomonas taeanensis]